MTPSVWPSILAFVVVIGLIPLALAVVKRAQNLRPQQQGALRLVGGLSVGPRERIAIVEADGQRLVVGITAQSIRLLTRLDDADGAARTVRATDTPAAAPASPFSRVLARMTTRVDDDVL
ncbi:MAG: flagellar biosynthetic protein FliO [Burkholderiaceae bacterium]